jgi:predicted ATP-grasp superfamily ATP-dependent carboligase
VTIRDTSTPVLILRSHSHGGLNIMRSLGPLGIKLFNLDPDPAAPAHHSRYCAGNFIWDVEHAPAEDSLAYLRAVQRRIGSKAILIPTTDVTTLFVERWKEPLRDLFLFPEQPAGLVEALCSKREMYFLAKRHGIPTPHSFFPSSRRELVELLDQLAFPVLLKGIYGQTLWERTRKKMYIVKDCDELLKLYVFTEDPGRPNLMIQEYIPGGDDTIWMFNGYFDDQSKCLIGFTGKKIRQCPVHTGSTSLGICLSNSAVDHTTRRFMKLIGYRGILDIGYRYDARDGLFKVLDINPRIGATFRLFVGTNGMDVARALYLDLTGQQVVPSLAPEGRKWMVEDLDLVSSFRYFREGELSVRDWLQSLSGVDETAFLSLRDPLPFSFMFLSRLRELWCRTMRPSRVRTLGPATAAATPSAYDAAGADGFAASKSPNRRASENSENLLPHLDES